MTAYVTITDGEIDQDSAVTQPLLTAIRDNPIAITEGAVGAPRVLIGALERLNPGTVIRSRSDAVSSTTSATDVNTFLFNIMQYGTIRLIFSQRSVFGSTSTAYIYRYRNGITTTIASWATASTSFIDRSADFGVLPGDQVGIFHKTSGTAVEVSTQRIQTNGESLWPGAVASVEGNVFL